MGTPNTGGANTVNVRQFILAIVVAAVVGIVLVAVLGPILGAGPSDV